ncbi:hypothetical protein [Roseixanthobacter liquoris]|uniref:hypothetical protein n=1 Tax=Roseixanthobacter liquoris TaxID=3119921 RepID=UPI003729EDF9
MMRLGLSLPSAALYRQRSQPPAPETLGLLARMSVPPSPARRTQIDTLVKGLIAAGLWTKLDALYLTAAHDAQAARLNLVPWTGTVTNLLPNSTMQGANVGTNTTPTGWAVGGPPGITRSLVGLGTVGGLPYIDVRYSGTLNMSGFIAAITFSPSLTGTPGGRYTHSGYFALVAGSFGATTASVNIQTLAADGITTVDNFSGSEFFTGLNSTIGRRLVTAVAGGTAAYVVPRLRMVFGSSGSVVDFTLRIAAPQLVRMDVPGNFVPTSGAAASQVQTLARFDLSAVNSPLFTVDRGYSGNGTTSYLDTNANPAQDFNRLSLNSATYGTWVPSEIAITSMSMGDAANLVLIQPRNDTGAVAARINDGGGITRSVASSVGLTAGDRAAAAARSLYKNGVELASDTTGVSVAMPTELYLLRRGVTFYPGQVSAAFAGASLTAAQHLALYSALRTYLIALGAAA